MVSHRSDHTNAEGVIVISSDSEEEEKEWADSVPYSEG